MNSKFCVSLFSQTGFFEINLVEVFNLIKNGKDYDWKVFYFSGQPLINRDKEFLSFYKKICNNKMNDISWDQLNFLISNMYQIYDGYFFGFSQTYGTKILIGIFDASYCQIFCDDFSLLKDVLKNFKIYEILEMDYEIDYSDPLDINIFNVPHKYSKFLNNEEFQYLIKNNHSYLNRRNI